MTRYKKPITKDVEVEKILKPYYSFKGQKDFRKDFIYLKGVPSEAAARLLGTYLQPDDYQNDSPSAYSLVGLAKKYNGKLGGYFIPKSSRRDDARVSFDTLFIPSDKPEVAKALNEITNPDEFNLYDTDGDFHLKGYYRLWWD